METRCPISGEGCTIACAWLMHGNADGREAAECALVWLVGNLWKVKESLDEVSLSIEHLREEA